MENKVNSINDLLSLLENYEFQFAQTYNSCGFIFRGMSNKEWPLLPSVFREYAEPQKASMVMGGSIKGRVYSASENEMLWHFKKESAGLLPHISQTNDFAWIQYAQHYGLPTRLLDFTANPLVALYFCCRTESAADGVVWIVNVPTFQRWSYDELFCLQNSSECTNEFIISSIVNSIKGYADDDIERQEKQYPAFFIPAYIDQRMSAQASRFLLWGKLEVPLEKMASEDNWMKRLDGLRFDKVKDQRFLANITVPSDSKHSILRQLDLLGINEKSVFPGLDSIGRYMERFYKRNANDICNFI